MADGNSDEDSAQHKLFPWTNKVKPTDSFGKPLTRAPAKPDEDPAKRRPVAQEVYDDFILATERRLHSPEPPDARPASNSESDDEFAFFEGSEDSDSESDETRSQAQSGSGRKLGGEGTVTSDREVTGGNQTGKAAGSTSDAATKQSWATGKNESSAVANQVRQAWRSRYPSRFLHSLIIKAVVR